MTIHPTAARGFDAGAEAYERGRPGYPETAIAWLTERLGLRPGRTVLDLAAGTGKLTRQLVPTGARVVAVEPTDAMRRQLERVLPGIEALPGTAEAIPLPDGSVDAVTTAQAYHWFDPERALPELHRVLRRGGGVAILWNTRDLDDPLQAAIDVLLEPVRGDVKDLEERDPRVDFGQSRLFRAMEERRFGHVQPVTNAGLLDAVVSRSYVAALPNEERDELLGRLRGLAATFPPPLELRYVTEVFMCFRQTEPA